MTEPKQILEYECQFYKNLYTQPSGTAVPSDPPFQVTPKISDLHRLGLNKPISPEELRAAVLKLNKGKCLGTDSLSVEFYLHFWELLERPLFDSIVASL